ncbi:hypothetical protein KY290_034483 [Solanum tuberosum]|uniref:Uncharacterized protein n=1 Tax=Solanum tuberosum TaxID=4113 RepID=A0ABQ7U6X7_SOLTU|nr:hypothetical protein KY290_034483 [Solanum tuberosum]
MERTMKGVTEVDSISKKLLLSIYHIFSIPYHVQSYLKELDSKFPRPCWDSSFTCSSASVHSTDIGLGHGELGASRVHDMHQRWQWRSWMNHGSFRGPRKYLVNPKAKHPFDVPKLPV